MSVEDQLKQGISPIDLGNCTKTIKEFYNIDEEENLIVLNQELKYNNENNITSENHDNSNNLEKYSQIEVYDISGRKLDLSVCKSEITLLKYVGNDENININTAKNYADMGIDIFNASSDFFNDICCKTNDGKDIILKDRRTDIFQNISFCQDGCKYEGMNYNLMVANCICDSSSLQGGTNVSEHKYNNTEMIQFESLLKSYLANSLTLFNLDVLHCYKLVFDTEILKTNIGFYFMLLMNALQISFLVIFLIKRLKSIKNYLTRFITLANPIKKNNYNRNTNRISLKIGNELHKNNNNIEIYNSSKKLMTNQNKDNIISKDELINKNEIAEKTLQLKENDNNDIIINNIYPKNRNKLDLHNPALNDEDKSSKEKIGENIINIHDIIEHKETVISGEEKIENKSDNFCINCINKIKLTQEDEDLQDIEYNEAVEKDQRSVFRIYWAYLIDSQIILGTFLTQNYLDLFIIKLSFLVFTFQISFFLNALFYTDDYISDAYHNDGVLDFLTGLPKSVYSFIATSITTNLLKMLSNSKSELLKIIRDRKKEDNYMKLVNDKLRKLNIKLIIYYIFLFVLGLFFLYYVTAFCAVYTHSQKYWFIGCIESFVIDSLFSLIVCILIAALRYMSIQFEKKLLYGIANIISIIV